MRMRRLFRFFMPVAIFSITIVSVVSSLAAQVVINEFMADPARDWDGDGEYYYRDDEWVEILNAGETSIELEGYMLSDTEGAGIWRYGFSGVILPGQVMIVYGSDSRAWEESSGNPVYGLSLNNTGDVISLFHVLSGDTVLVDEVTYGASAAQDDRSAGRSLHSESEWEVFDAYNPCGSDCDPVGNGCIPTPGLVNTCTTSVSPSSWGRIKKMYNG
jgi:hypothetical protein